MQSISIGKWSRSGQTRVSPWSTKSILNPGHTGRISSDLTIGKHAETTWEVKPVTQPEMTRRWTSSRQSDKACTAARD